MIFNNDDYDLPTAAEAALLIPTMQPVTTATITLRDAQVVYVVVPDLSGRQIDLMEKAMDCLRWNFDRDSHAVRFAVSAVNQLLTRFRKRG